MGARTPSSKLVLLGGGSLKHQEKRVGNECHFHSLSVTVITGGKLVVSIGAASGSGGSSVLSGVGLMDLLLVLLENTLQ